MFDKLKNIASQAADSLSGDDLKAAKDKLLNKVEDLTSHRDIATNLISTIKDKFSSIENLPQEFTYVIALFTDKIKSFESLDISKITESLSSNAISGFLSGGDLKSTVENLISKVTQKVSEISSHTGEIKTLIESVSSEAKNDFNELSENGKASVSKITDTIKSLTSSLTEKLF